MRIEIHGVNTQVSDATREQTNKKLEKFQRIFKGENAICTVKYQPAKRGMSVEITLKIRRHMYRVESEAQDSITALDEAVSNLERKIRKHKTKIKRNRHAAPELPTYFEAVPELEEAEVAEEVPKIARRKKFAIDVMDPEEAALQMELIGHDFFIFINAETGQVSVLYRRHDNNYGLLEPEY